MKDPLIHQYKYKPFIFWILMVQLVFPFRDHPLEKGKKGPTIIFE